MDRLYVAIRIICSFSILFSFQPNKLLSDTKDDSTKKKFIELAKYEKEGKYDEAIFILKKELARENNVSNKIQIITRIGLNYWNLGKIDESFTYYQNATEFSKKYAPQKDVLVLEQYLDIYKYYNLGKKLRSQGDTNGSKACFEKAIIISNRLGSKEHLIKCQRQLGALYYELNDKNSFYKLNLEAYNSAKSISLKREEEYCSYNLGLYFQSIDDYSDAIEYFSRSYQLASQFFDESDKSSCLMSIGTVYLKLGLLDKSLNYLISALEIDEQIGDIYQLSMDLNNIGITYRTRGYSNHNFDDFYSALSYYKRAYKYAIRLNNTKLQLIILNNIGSVLTSLDKNYEALDYFNKVLKLSEKISFYDLLTNVLNNLGIVHANLGNYEKSIEYYLKSIEIAQHYQSGQSLWEAYLEIGNSYKNQNKNELAIENYKKSIAIIENIRTKIDLEEYRASYLGSNKRSETYFNLIDLLVRMNQFRPNQKYAQDLFFYLERAKARSFLESLEISNINIDYAINIKLISREKNILNDISQLYSKLLNAGMPPKQIFSLNNELKKKEEEYDLLKKEIWAENPAYAELKYPDIITFINAQKFLPDSRTAFFIYLIGKSKSYGFVLTKKRLKIFSIPGSQQLQMKISLHLKNLTDKENHDFKLSHELYSLLVYPGLDREIKTIIFCPDDILNYLPFETLLFSPNNNDWLIKKYNVSYAPSISSLRELVLRERRDHPKLSKDIFLAGDPDYGEHEVSTDMESGSLEGFYNGTPIKLGRLEFSSLELKKISALFNKNKFSSFYKKEANEQLLKTKNLNGYKIIHLAAHTLIDDRNPGRSSIILSLNQNSEEDGFLQMREIFNLRMNADLVTLSACDTGLGQLIRGEGIVGLNRAFFFAGANAVLMSLWAVHDEASSQLMERFYYHLKKGTSISNALRSAKIEMIGSRNLSHPYYWAGFVISGDANQIIFSKKSVLWIPLLVLSIATAFVLLFLLIGRKKKKYY